MKSLGKRHPKASDQHELTPAASHQTRSNLAFSTPFRLALIDSRGDIVAVNEDWLALAEKTGASMNRVGPGANYLEVCRRARRSSDDSILALRGINAVLEERTSSFSMDYRCSMLSGSAYFRMDATRLAYKEACVCVAHTEVTNSELSKEKNFKLMQQFALRLINAQEEERQRISQELHDDLGNRIGLMALSLRQIIKEASSKAGSNLTELDEVFHQVTDLSAAVRDISHGLHPLLLRHIGIKVALKSLHETFEKTHGIRTDLTVAEELPQLPHKVALCIFRITQECLRNVAKHSGADRVSITLGSVPGHISLAVSDTGRGFVNQSEAIRKGGLGLLSMEARALSVGGRLTVNSSPESGTEIRLTVPLPKGRG
jgi:signal transduction histidine kinase